VIAQRLRPRDTIRIVRLAGTEPQLTALRALHPGGVPESMPTHWAGAYQGTQLVAAVGWLEDKPGFRFVVEVDRDPGRPGMLGTLVLIKGIAASSKRAGIRLQAAVLPGNERLKEALHREGARCIIEIWEALEPGEEPT
jgi:hypothetical protein